MERQVHSSAPSRRLLHNVNQNVANSSVADFLPGRQDFIGLDFVTNIFGAPSIRMERQVHSSAPSRRLLHNVNQNVANSSVADFLPGRQDFIGLDFVTNIFGAPSTP
jgi:hypothetical protein